MFVYLDTRITITKDRRMFSGELSSLKLLPRDMHPQPTGSEGILSQTYLISHCRMISRSDIIEKLDSLWRSNYMPIIHNGVKEYLDPCQVHLAKYCISQ